MDRQEFIAEGHRIITDGLARAKTFSSESHVYASVEQTLRSLWAHMASAMDETEQPVDVANAKRPAPEPDDVDPPKDPTLKVQG